MDIVEAKNASFIDAMNGLTGRGSLSVLYTTAGAIRLSGLRSLRYNAINNIMTKHGKWFRYSLTQETIELEVFDVVTTPPVQPLTADAEAFATLLCGRVDCVTMSGAISMVTIKCQQVRSIARSPESPPLTPRRPQVSSWDLATIAGLGSVLDITLRPSSIGVSVVQDTDVSL